jgi:serine/threonine protein kinase
MLHDRYQIEKELGRGGFGAVYQAWDGNLNRPCALKENLDTSPEAQRQFQREATVLANLTHPNLPRVTDHFVIAGQGQYLVMDFVEGEDLGSKLENQGALDAKTAVGWITQVADALIYLHTKNPPVLHRDIKPANIRVTPEGKAILVDFGLVKLYDPHSKTTQGARAVTPGFAPPEQYGRGSTDIRSDIYALGATLYTLVTGHDPVESVQRMANDTVQPAHVLNPRVSLRLGQTIEHAMALKPDQRFQSAVEFKAALQNLDQRPNPAHYEATMIAPSPPPGSAAAGASYNTPTPAYPPANYPPAYGTPQKSVPPPKSVSAPAAAQRKRNPGCVIALVILGLVVLCVGAFSLLGLWGMFQPDSNPTATTIQQTSTALTATQTAVRKTTPTLPGPPTPTTSIDFPSPTPPPTYDQLLDNARNWPVVMVDYFTDNQNEWTDGTDDNDFCTLIWSIADGSYVWEATAKQGFVWYVYPSGAESADFYLAAEMEHIKGPSTAQQGFIFRHNGEIEADLSQYYLYLINAQGEFSVYLYDGGAWTELAPWQQTSALTYDYPNLMEVVAQGSLLSFYINGQQVAEINDTTLTKGKVGLAVSLNQNGDQAVWDFANFQLRSP